MKRLVKVQFFKKISFSKRNVIAYAPFQLPPFGINIFRESLYNHLVSNSVNQKLM